MATYAAYRHVELDKVGYGKRSIMKPPGGDCHDIFGADFHGTPSHHRVLKPPGGGTSNVFSSSVEDEPKRGSNRNPEAVNSNSGLDPISDKNGKDWIDGDLIQSKSSDYSENMEKKSSNPEILSTHSSVLSAEIKTLTAQEEKRTRASLMSRNCVTGEGCQTTDHFVIRVHRQRDGNPVTGEGYDTPDPNSQPTGATRARVPPGGYSSGLW